MSEAEQPNPAPASRRGVPAWVWLVAFAIFWIVLTQWIVPAGGGRGFL